ncbi:hypothetical protein D9M72_514710 [compost metagenome]
MPDLLLEGRAADVEIDHALRLVLVDEADDLAELARQRRLLELQLDGRKLGGELVMQRLRVLCEQDGADAALAAADKNLAQHRLADSEADVAFHPAARGTEVVLERRNGTGLHGIALCGVEGWRQLRNPRPFLTLRSLRSKFFLAIHQPGYLATSCSHTAR